MKPMIWTVFGDIPCLKNTLRRSKSGAFYHANDGVREYKNLFALQTPAKFKKNLTCQVEVNLSIVRKNNRKDASNLEAVIFDCLQDCGVIKNDRQVVKWSGLALKTDNLKPCVIVEVRELKTMIKGGK